MDKWMLNRLGLLNFWYYDEEEFPLANGKLLLRGGNGSGKSVTMQSFIPLLLDGNKSPERLDPFRSRARRLEDYLLLGEDGKNGLDERTGYLYIEFKREELDEYITVGMGLRARTRKPMDFWGFSITDGRRINRDVTLQNGGIPLNKRELRDLVGEGGKVVETQSEYMEMVNQLIFGFDTVEEYDELIKLLIELRSPKLSRGFKPSVLYDIMNDSLPALSDEDLRPLTETVENMDQLKLRIDQLRRAEEGARKLRVRYHRYNQYMLYTKAYAYIDALEEARATEERLKKLRQKLASETRELDEIGQRIEELDLEQKTLKEREEQLRDNDIFKVETQYQSELERKSQLSIKIGDKETQLKEKREQDRISSEKYRSAEAIELDAKDDLHGILEELDLLADEIEFHNHHHNKRELGMAPQDKVDFQFWYSDIETYQGQIRAGRQALERREEANRVYDSLLKEQDSAMERVRKLKEEELQARGQLESVRREFISMVQSWQRANKLFLISDEEIVRINRIALQYGEGQGYSDIVEIVRGRLDEYQSKYSSIISGLEHELSLFNKTIEELRVELEGWRQKKDPEPERDEQVIRNRELLREEGIPHIPLYMAIEFREGLTDEIKGNIESGLRDMGILDALIIPPSYREHVFNLDIDRCDKYIFANPKVMSQNLRLLLEPGKLEDCNVSAEYIGDALESLLVYREDGDFYLDERGRYGLGIVGGVARQGVEPRFIGVEARRNYRESMIRDIESRLDEVRSAMEEKREELSKAKEDRTIIMEEYRAFPRERDLEAALGMWREIATHLEVAEENLEIKSQALSDQLKVLNIAIREAEGKTRNLDLEPKLPAYIEAERSSVRYIRELNGYSQVYYRYVKARQDKEIHLENLERIHEDMDIIKGELNELEYDYRECIKLIEQLEELKAQPEYRQIEQEIEVCILRLHEIPREIRVAVERRGTLTNSIEGVERDVENTESSVIENGNRVSYLEEAFLAERELGFLDEFRVADEALEHAKAICKGLRSEVGSIGIDGNRLVQELHNTIYETRPELVDYGVVSESIWEDKRDANIDFDISRYIVKGRVGGRELSIYDLHDWIVDEIETNRSLLRETDRQLFEEIIMRTLGHKIRSKIFRADKWVSSMNELMSRRDSSSGLTFQLQWKPKPAEAEDQLDTRELVNILRADTSILKEADFNKVTEHFRSKVDQAKKAMQYDMDGHTFHQIIKEVLDYRQWFEFKLFYKKEGENRRELTNRAFDRLSGGEKAMAMYIPLFSSVYSRYQSASATAPYIISLDEAFAGVDDRNIRDMFKLMEELGFNYIINSQALWGDYDTVSSLSICELVRPRNASYVTVIKYIWNGSERQLVLDDKAL